MTEQEHGHRRRWVLVAIGIIAFGVIGLAAMRALRPQPQIEPPAQRAAFVTGTPVQWQRGHIEVEGSGRVSAFREVRLQAQVSGDVTFVSEQLQPGGRFAEGDLLIRINPAPFAAREKELAAQLASANADLALARSQAKRARELLAERAAAREEVDQREATVLAAQARVEQIDAALSSARIDLARTDIRAPFDGRVLSESVSIGDVLAPGASFAEIYANDVFEIPVALSESDAALVGDLFADDRLDLPARVVATYGGVRFAWPGRVHRVEPGLDRTTRTIDLRVRVDDPESRGAPLGDSDTSAPPLLLGAFATVFIESRDVGEFVELPRAALRPDDTIWYVVADDDGSGNIEVADTQVLRTDERVAFLKPDIPMGGNVFALDPAAGRLVPGSLVTVSDSSAESASRAAASPGTASRAP